MWWHGKPVLKADFKDNQLLLVVSFACFPVGLWGSHLLFLLACLQPIIDSEIIAVDKYWYWATRDLSASGTRKDEMSDLVKLRISNFGNYLVQCSLLLFFSKTATIYGVFKDVFCWKDTALFGHMSVSAHHKQWRILPVCTHLFHTVWVGVSATWVCILESQSELKGQW